MKTNMLSNLKALREFWHGLLEDLIIKVMGEEGPEFLEELKKFLRKEPCWVPVTAVPSLLKYLGTLTIPATGKRFIARGHFKKDTSENAKVKIFYLGDNFTGWFLNGEGKIEEPVGEITLRCHTLTKGSVDGPIITELGGEEKAETSLQEVFALMQKQPKGEDSSLLTNGYANIFYVHDTNGVLRAVFVYWLGGDWRVDARSVENPSRWLEGHQVFSR